MTNGKPQTLLPLDRLGQSWAWKIERLECLPRVQAAVSAGKPVAVYQDAGRGEWWSSYSPWPAHFERLTAWPKEKRWEALIVLSDRVLSLPPPGLEDAMLIYRPPTLALGVACRRGLSLEELEECTSVLFQRHRLCITCLTAVGVPANRKHESALVAFAEDRELPLLPYGADKLRLAFAVANGPDARLSAARRCEAAALLAAGVTELAVAKMTFTHLALAVARRPSA